MIEWALRNWKGDIFRMAFRIIQVALDCVCAWTYVAKGIEVADASIAHASTG